MKKFLIFIAGVAMMASCGVSREETDRELKQQRDSLQAIIDNKDNELNDIIGTMTEVQESIRRISEAEGRIVVVLTERDAEKAVRYLLSQPILGIDTETRPSFKKGQTHQVALLQVSSYDVCFLFRLNQLGMSPSVKRLLEDRRVPKIGLSLRDDLLSLHKLGDFNAGYFIDLQDHVREIGVEDLSLQKLYANFFAQKISKREQLTNWEADILQDKQKLYAATDAWSCIMLYEELIRLERTGDYELIKVIDDVQRNSA